MDPELADILSQQLEEVEERLFESVRYSDTLAATTSRYLLEAGGKRIRPLLVLLAAQLGDASRSEILDAAVAVELTHLATLYHDDVMDSASTRRGAPAAHQVWGNSVAILTGDLLFARASQVTAKMGPDAVLLQANTFERLCLGQLHETVGPGVDDDHVEHYISVLADKTASLISASGRYGAECSGCGPEIVQMLVEYGEKVGIAFQLADDVIDLASGRDVSGKTPGTDLREGVPTMPLLLFNQHAGAQDPDAATRETAEVLAKDLTDDDNLAAAVVALREHQATAEAQQLAQQWSDDAVSAIDGLEDGPAKDALVSFARAVVQRAA